MTGAERPARFDERSPPPLKPRTFLTLTLDSASEFLRFWEGGGGRLCRRWEGREESRGRVDGAGEGERGCVRRVTGLRARATTARSFVLTTIAFRILLDPPVHHRQRQPWEGRREGQPGVRLREDAGERHHSRGGGKRGEEEGREEGGGCGWGKRRGKDGGGWGGRGLDHHRMR